MSIEIIKQLTAKAHRLNFRKLKYHDSEIESLQEMKKLSIIDAVRGSVPEEVSRKSNKQKAFSVSISAESGE
jgi:hypothetical protein